MPHLLFYGPNGAGKKTRISALLRQIYGPGVDKLRLEHRVFELPNASKTKIELTTTASNHHIEINPSDAGHHDRVVVNTVIKEIAQYHPIDAATQKPFKIVLLTDVDRLSKDAQHALRRTMEKYSSSCRIILSCNSPSKVIEPVRSRCLGIRVAAPTNEEICSVLQEVVKKEQLKIPPELATKIADHSGRNLRKAILTMEACRIQQYPFTADQAVQVADWERYIAGMAREIAKEQSPQKLLQTREKLFELLTNCIPADEIIKCLAKELMKVLDDELKHEVMHWAAFYEHRMQLGSKEIYHLEAFVAKFMAIYKRYIMNLYG
jgi:replication factor C subunit 3/5